MSSLVDGLRRTLQGRGATSAGAVDEPDVDEIEDPEPAPEDRSWSELRLTAPADAAISVEATAQFLATIGPGTEPIAYELRGTAERITVHLACPSEDAAGLAQALRAYFPVLAVAAGEDTSLAGFWDAPDAPAVAITDFALGREWMLPLRLPRGFTPDPLTALVAGLATLDGHERGLLQVLLMPAREPWAEESQRAVIAQDGRPFFADAPELTRQAHVKTSQPLFAAVVRLATRAKDPERAEQLLSRLAAGLRTLDDAAGNRLVALDDSESEPNEREADLLGRQTRRSGMLLSGLELSGLVHPPSAALKVEKLVRVVRRTKAAPATVQGEGTVLGTNSHAGKTVTVRLPPDLRARHVYVVGGSGMGKSNLLLSMIVQDLEAGAGLAVLDPHGDLIDDVVAHVPDGRLKDVVLFDPADAEHPIGFNVLAAHSELEKTLLSSDLVAVFRRLSTSWGDQMNTVLANAIRAFLERDGGGTLHDLKRFLVEPGFRREVLDTVRDREVVYYWQREFPLLAGKPQGPILTRLSAFLYPRLIRNMVAQRENRLDIGQLMDSGQVLLIKLAEGAIGAENAHLLGTLLVAKFQQLAMARQEQAKEHRRAFTLYVDEFHHFATPSMEEILSGARKYNLGLVLAHQNLRQLAARDRELLSSVLANPGTRVCFRVGDEDARLLEEGFASFDRKDLQSLGRGEAIVRADRSDHDFPITTTQVLAVPEDAAARRREAIVAQTRERYARPRAEVEDLIAKSREESSAAADEEQPARRQARDRTLENAERPKEWAGGTKTRPEPRRAAASSPPASDTPGIRPEWAELKRDEIDERPTGLRRTPAPAGRGGAKHRYLQELLRGWGEQHEFRATVEEGLPDGAGSVDVTLRRGDLAIACEIAVSQGAEHELANVQKCLAAGFTVVIMLAVRAGLRRNLEKLVVERLDEAERARVHCVAPEQAIELLTQIAAASESRESTVRGYKVKARMSPVDAAADARRREGLTKVVGNALRRLRGKG